MPEINPNPSATQSRVLRVLSHRNPNWVPVWIIYRELAEVDQATIDQALQALEQSKRVTRFAESVNLQHDPVVAFQLADPASHGERETIELGEFSIPRMRANDSVSTFPEVFNYAVENLARHALEIDAAARERSQREQREFWGTMVSVFSVFASVIALIVTGFRTTPSTISGNFCDVLLLQVAELGPIALVLAGFVFLTRRIVGGA